MEGYVLIFVCKIAKQKQCAETAGGGVFHITLLATTVISDRRKLWSVFRSRTDFLTPLMTEAVSHF